MKYCLSLVLAITWGILASAQLNVQTSDDLATLVQQSFAGEGVEISNVQLTHGSATEQIGSFNALGVNFPILQGMIMSTGHVSGAVGPNTVSDNTAPIEMVSTSSDPDLEALSSTELLDFCVLEFDFVPQGNEVSFEYVFASEEYQEYVNAGFNDIFAFFISSDNQGLLPTNIAIVPGSDVPVSIDNINEGSNAQFYVDNGASTAPNPGDPIQPPYSSDAQYVQYDAFTTALVASSEVICGETYHFKLAIADAGDGSLDSAVFLKKNSFNSPSLNVSLQQPTFLLNANSAIEDCDFTSITITRTGSAVSEELGVLVEFGGQAENGVDYTGIPDSFVFEPGQSSVTLDFLAIEDNLAEDAESIVLGFLFQTECITAPEPVEIEFFIIDQPPIAVVGEDLAAVCPDAPFTIDVTAIGGAGNTSFVWSTGETTEDITYATTTDDQLTVTATDFCGTSADLAIDVEVLDVSLTFVDSTLIASCNAPLVMNVQAESALPLSYEWFEGDSLFSTAMPTTLDSTYDASFQIAAIDFCGNVEMANVNVLVQDPAMELSISDGLLVCSGGTAVVSLAVENAFEPVTYEWSVEGVPNSAAIGFTPVEDAVVFGTVTDACDRTQTLFTTVDVSEVDAEFDFSYNSEVEVQFLPSENSACEGCVYHWSFGDGSESLDFAPIHEYSDLAIYDVEFTVTNPDGCVKNWIERIEPEVLLFVPNSFTPDQDGVNEVWQVKGFGVVEYEIRIFNRWGKEVFRSSDMTEAWLGEGAFGRTHYSRLDVYSYLIEYKGANQIPLEKKGVIIPVR